MTSRWAFEALAVAQYHDNAFMQRQYLVERRLSEAKYYLNFWLPELKARLEEAQTLRGSANVRHKIRLQQLLRVTQNSFRDGLARYPSQEFGFVDRLTPEGFTDRAAAQALRTLDALRVKFGAQQRKAMQERDALLTEARQNGVDVEALQQNHHNEALEQLVLNQDSPDRIAEIGGRLVQLADPIYKNVAPGKGAHFYAPQKRLLGSVVDTFAFNLGVVWAMIAVLYATLYFEAFRKIGWGVRRLQALRKRG
jgi:hypothetical protein